MRVSLKKISQLKSDIRSCLKQASGPIGGGDPDSPPRSATANKLLIHEMSIPPGPTNSPVPPFSLVLKIVKRAYTCKQRCHLTVDFLHSWALLLCPIFGVDCLNKSIKKLINSNLVALRYIKKGEGHTSF